MRVPLYTKQDSVQVSMFFQRGGKRALKEWQEERVCVLPVAELLKVSTTTESRRWYAFVGKFKGGAIGLGFKACSNMKAIEALPETMGGAQTAQQQKVVKVETKAPTIEELRAMAAAMQREKALNAERAEKANSGGGGPVAAAQAQTRGPTGSFTSPTNPVAIATRSTPPPGSAAVPPAAGGGAARTGAAGTPPGTIAIRGTAATPTRPQQNNAPPPRQAQAQVALAPAPAAAPAPTAAAVSPRAPQPAPRVAQAQAAPAYAPTPLVPAADPGFDEYFGTGAGAGGGAGGVDDELSAILGVNVSAGAAASGMADWECAAPVFILHARG